MKERGWLTFVVGYFIIGAIFAVFYATYYKWPVLSIFSPGFYAVMVTWPAQIFPFISQIIGNLINLISL